jgi:NAD(P)-dependent dehydrogenase (short-subunit alcohol dehydrogenase family)
MSNALVTGGNRGIGLEVSRQLARQGWRVYLAARQPADAEEASASLRAERLDVVPVQLDVADDASIDALARRFERDGVRLNALINNAGVRLDGFDAATVEKTLAVNLHGPLHLTDRLRALLEPHANIVMVSSGLGALSQFPPELRARFDPPKSRDAVLSLMRSFVEDVRSGVHTRHGWPSSAYDVSKAALNALSRVLAEELRDVPARVNAVSPGWVRSRMGGASAPRSLEQGADGIVWAATLPPDGPTGGLFSDRRAMEW